MNLYRPTDLLKFLDAYQLRPNKKLSQNFLIDQNILNKIVRLTNLDSKQCVLEIGPGPGALTQKLLETGAKVIAIEKDQGFAKALQRLSNSGNLEIIHADILQVDLQKILPENAKVIANLPYNITSKLLSKILEIKHIDLSIVMVQKEIAERMCAQSKSKAYSRLSIFMQLQSMIKYEFDVKASCFFPKPSVNSSIVQFSPKSRRPSKHFFEFIKKAFCQKRKMLKVSLSSLYDKLAITEALTSFNQKTSARVQDLSPTQLLELYHLLNLNKPSFQK